MTFLKALPLLTVLSLGGCYTTRQAPSADQSEKGVSDSVSKSTDARESEETFKQVSLNKADQSQSMTEGASYKPLQSPTNKS